MAETKPTTFRLDDKSREWFTRYGAPWAHQIRDDATLLQTIYEQTSRQMAGKFTIAEAGALIDMQNATLFDPGQAGSAHTDLYYQSQDSIALYPEFATKHSLANGGRDFLEKVQGLTLLEGLTLTHLCRVYWQRVAVGLPAGDEQIQALFRAAD